MPVLENERGTFLFNSRDLCMAAHVDDLIDSGIDSFKIEGRMKNALYVATVARTYRRAIDDCISDREGYLSRAADYEKQISDCTHRLFCTGFFYGKPGPDSQIYGESTYVKEYTYLGYVEDVRADGLIRLTQKNKFCLGDEIEIIKPGGEDIPVRVEAIYDEDMKPVPDAPHARQRLFVKLSQPADRFDVLRCVDKEQ